ncbi:hypothetical protein ECC24_07145 [Helicobacter pylori]|nr:hypothetical protein ECC24_07145 [Helicobacter pylori]
MSKFLPHDDSKFWHFTMLILTYSQTPLRALKNEIFKLKNGVFKFRATIAYHHLIFIYKGRFKP